VGYFAYLIPLKAVNADAAYLYANHVAYLRDNCSLEQALQRKPRWLMRLLRGLLAPAIGRSKGETHDDLGASGQAGGE
jgi:hypothetical protein